MAPSWIIDTYTGQIGSYIVFKSEQIDRHIMDVSRMHIAKAEPG